MTTYTHSKSEHVKKDWYQEKCDENLILHLRNIFLQCETYGIDPERMTPLFENSIDESALILYNIYFEVDVTNCLVADQLLSRR